MRKRGIQSSILTILFALLSATQSFAMPTCRVVSGVKGAPAILINGQPFAPLFFCANNQFNRDEVLLEEIRLTADAGIPLIAFNVPLAWDGPTDVAPIIDTFCKAHPSAYFYIRVWLGGSRASLDAHPDALMRKADGDTVPWVSIASETWRDEASRLLRECLTEIVNGPHSDKFIGVMVSAQSGGEWFYPETNEFLDYSQANIDGFRAWLRKRYLNDKALRRAWKDESISLKSVTIPTPELRDSAATGPFRNPATHRPAIEYHQYLSELVASNIQEFATVAKRATHDRALVGAFYGYTMELNGVGPRALANSGHLAFAKLLNVPEIDLIHAPYSYANRGLGNPGHFHLPLDSVPLHGKLVIIEEDSRTPIAVRVPQESLAAGNVNVADSLDGVLAVNRRNIANALTHGAGLWYFDVLADGRWNDKQIWATAGLTRRMFAQTRGSESFKPQIAVVVDEESVHALRTTTHPYLSESLASWRTELDRLGAPVGYYLQSDLPRLPESLHVIILANAYVISEMDRRALDRFLKKGGTVVWTFTPDAFSPNGLDPARMHAATGMKIELEEGSGPLTLNSTVTSETWQLADSWQLRFKVTSTENVHAIAEYADTKSVAAAATPHKGGISVYTAVPRLPVGVLRWIATNSAVHLYRDTPGMVGLFGPYFVVHTDEEATHTFRLPAKMRSVERVIPYTQVPIAVDADSWRDALPANTTAIYRLNQ